MTSPVGAKMPLEIDDDYDDDFEEIEQGTGVPKTSFEINSNDRY